MAFTFFFRDVHTLTKAVEHVVPLLSGHRRPAIWDAGCATGQEPYTLAILLAERMSQFGFRNLRIVATDIDETDRFGKVVREGVYPSSDLQRLPANLREKYFEPMSDERLRIVRAIRERITFRKHNLLTLESVGDEFSLIVCKNVLLHLQPDARVEVLRMFHAALAPGGCLVMEQTQKLPVEIESVFRQVVPDAQLFARLEVTNTTPFMAEPLMGVGETDRSC